MNRFLFLGALAAAAWAWRQFQASQSGGMSRAEAARLLNVSPLAGTTAVNESYKRLIARVHPDAGGSAELAAQVNQARDVLLKKHR